MLPRYLDFLNQPAEQEFFTKFAGIYSRDDGDAVQVTLTSIYTDNNNVEYCDKILIGETLRESVKRALFDNFGLHLVDYWLSVLDHDIVKNKHGKSITRFTIFAYVSYAKLKKDILVGCKTKWIKRPDAVMWLKNSNLNTLGKNSPLKKENVLSFVLDLYSAGALDVEIYELYREEEESFDDQLNPDYIDIRLPKNEKQRNQILHIVNTGIKGHVQTEKKSIDPDQTTLQYYWN